MKEGNANYHELRISNRRLLIFQPEPVFKSSGTTPSLVRSLLPQILSFLILIFNAVLNIEVL